MFNTSFQNVVTNQNTDTDPYQDQYFGQGDKTPYIQALTPPLPGAANSNRNNFYPLQASLATPSLSPTSTGYPSRNFAKGGKVTKQDNIYPSLAEMIRQQGGMEDTILAHINPIEAELLGKLSPAARINPITQLPQFGFFDKPGKWLKSIIGGGAGALIGNAILPGIGGIIGGALGNAAGAAARGRKDIVPAALKGAGIGAAVPSIASGLGWGANALGATGVANTLQNYGTQNAILPALGLGKIGSSSSISPLAGIAAGSLSAGVGNNNQILMPKAAQLPESALLEQLLLQKGYAKEPETNNNFLEQLLKNTGSFLAQPQNLLTTGVLASSFLNRPKEKSPEQLAAEHKRYQNALLLNANELKNKEAALLAEAQMKRRIERDKFLPEERLGPIAPLYMKTHTPEEYRRAGRWTSYYNNPEFSGSPINMKKGGPVVTEVMMEKDIALPFSLGTYIQGNTKGQADKIEALLSDGEYVIPADVVAAQGDGNNAAGAKELDKYVYNIRKHKSGGEISNRRNKRVSKGKLPPKAKAVEYYMKGGK